jgi:hypothetical protein
MAVASRVLTKQSQFASIIDSAPDDLAGEACGVDVRLATKDGHPIIGEAVAS